MPFTALLSAKPTPPPGDLLVYVTGGDGLSKPSAPDRPEAGRGALLRSTAAGASSTSSAGARQALRPTSPPRGCVRTAAADLRRPALARSARASAPVLIIPNVRLAGLLLPRADRPLPRPRRTGPGRDGLVQRRRRLCQARREQEAPARRRTHLPDLTALRRGRWTCSPPGVVPEIKRAFQAEIATADRILLARYDDTGGYFTRHRDNAAPHTAFREFAVSINLNTDDYEGGELLFAEFDDHRYSPPAGSAIIFSASLLHEAAPVTKGSRYVLLSFLGTATVGAAHRLDREPESPGVLTIAEAMRPRSLSGPSLSGAATRMLIRQSTYVHLTPLSEDRVLIVHAISHLRLVIDAEVAGIVAWFQTPRDMPGDLAELRERLTIDADTLAGCLASLMERGIAPPPTTKPPRPPPSPTRLQANCTAAIPARRSGPAAPRRPAKAPIPIGRSPRPWARTTSASSQDPPLGRASCSAIATSRWRPTTCAVRPQAATSTCGSPQASPATCDWPRSGRTTQAIYIGALRSRHLVAQGSAADHGGDPAVVYVAEARQVIDGLRAHSDAPILIDALPEPTVQPLGFADRGPFSHRNRFRAVDQGLRSAGRRIQQRRLRRRYRRRARNAEGLRPADGRRHEVDFTHFGSPGWMLQRPAGELAAVHNAFPDTAPLNALVGGRPLPAARPSPPEAATWTCWRW